MAKMLRKAATKNYGICACRKHHKPTRAWRKMTRHQARAVDKRRAQRDIDADR